MNDLLLPWLNALLERSLPIKITVFFSTGLFISIVSYFLIISPIRKNIAYQQQELAQLQFKLDQINEELNFLPTIDELQKQILALQQGKQIFFSEKQFESQISFYIQQSQMTLLTFQTLSISNKYSWLVELDGSYLQFITLQYQLLKIFPLYQFEKIIIDKTQQGIHFKFIVNIMVGESHK